MKIVSYWETPKNETTIQPWILLSLAVMKKMMGGDFILLTRHNLSNYLSPLYLEKDYKFNTLPFDANPEHLKLVAKSDVIRYAFIKEHGGIYLDADTIILENNLLNFLDSLIIDERLYWGNDVFFGAKKENETISKILDNIMSNDFYQWGNPGNIKSLVITSNKNITILPEEYYTPGYEVKYNFDNCNLIFRQDIGIDEFLINKSIKMIKLYNTYFSRTSNKCLSVEEFLSKDTLFSKLFLSIDNKKSLVENANVIFSEII